MAALTLMAMICAITLHMGHRYRTLIHQANADRLMIRRAQYIAISVTSREGDVYCARLDEILAAPPTDLLWDQPQAAFLWRGDADRQALDT